VGAGEGVSAAGGREPGDGGAGDGVFRGAGDDRALRGGWAAALVRDASAAGQALRATLETNNGDDTYTARYSATSSLGAGSWTYKFRCLGGAVSVWDDYDDGWHDYAGRQSVGHGFTPAYGFVQFIKAAGVAFPAVYLTAFNLSYLL